MTKTRRIAVFSVGTLAIVTGVAIIFFWPEHGDGQQSIQTGGFQSNNNVNSTVTQKHETANSIYYGPVTYNPAPPVHTRPSIPRAAPLIVSASSYSQVRIGCVRSDVPLSGVHADASSSAVVEDIGMGKVAGSKPCPTKFGSIPQPIDPNIAKLGNDALKKAVNAYTTQIVILEREYRSRVDASISAKDGKQFLIIREENDIFETKFKTAGLSLRNELMYRLKAPMTQEIYDNTMSLENDITFLSGNAPLTVISSELNEMAMRLGA